MKLAGYLAIGQNGIPLFFFTVRVLKIFGFEFLASFSNSAMRKKNILFYICCR